MEYPYSQYQFLNQDAQLANLKPPTCTTTSVTFLSCALPIILEPSSDRTSQQSYQLDEITVAPSNQPSNGGVIESQIWLPTRIQAKQRTTSVLSKHGLLLSPCRSIGKPFRDPYWKSTSIFQLSISSLPEVGKRPLSCIESELKTQL
jgi:hypothetical protein